MELVHKQVCNIILYKTQCCSSLTESTCGLLCTLWVLSCIEILICQFAKIGLVSYEGEGDVNFFLPDELIDLALILNLDYHLVYYLV